MSDREVTMEQVVVIKKELFDQIKCFVDNSFQFPATKKHQDMGEHLNEVLNEPTSYQVVEVPEDDS